GLGFGLLGRRFRPCLRLRRGRLGPRGLRRGFGLRPGLSALGEDLGNADHRELLAMAALAARILAPALLERDDLFAAALLDDLAGHRGAGHMGAADQNALAADEE